MNCNTDNDCDTETRCYNGRCSSLPPRCQNGKGVTGTNMFETNPIKCGEISDKNTCNVETKCSYDNINSICVDCHNHIPYENRHGEAEARQHTPFWREVSDIWKRGWDVIDNQYYNRSPCGVIRDETEKREICNCSFGYAWGDALQNGDRRCFTPPTKAHPFGPPDMDCYWTDDNSGSNCVHNYAVDRNYWDHRL